MISEVSKIPLIVDGISLPALMCQACFINPLSAVDGFLGSLRQPLDCFHESTNGVLLSKRLSGIKCGQTLVHSRLDCPVILSAPFGNMSEQDMERSFEADSKWPVRVGKEPQGGCQMASIVSGTPPNRGVKPSPATGIRSSSPWVATVRY